MQTIKNKLIKISILLAVVFGISTNFRPSEVAASLGNPTIVAYIYENGVEVPLGNKVATSPVTLKSSVPVIFYLYDNAITQTYSTSTTINKGYSKNGLDYYAIDQMNRMSDKVTVRLDLNQPPILTGVTTPAGLETVTLNAMKDSYFVVNGVKSTELALTKTFTERGDYTVYAESHDGLKSNVMTFSIPTKAAQVTTTTKPIVTTTKPNTTNTSKKTTTSTTTLPGSVALTLQNVMNGGMTNQDVIIETKEDVIFIVNGVKESKKSKTMTFTNEGTYTVTAENAKKQVSEEVTFVIDKTSPIISLQINGEDQNPGIFKEPVTIVSDEQGVFYVNGEETYGTNNAITISDAGTYTVEFVDLADNKTSIDFVLNIDNPSEKPSQNGDSSWILYLVIGLIAGAGIAFGGSYLLNKKKS